MSRFSSKVADYKLSCNVISDGCTARGNGSLFGHRVVFSRGRRRLVRAARVPQYNILLLHKLHSYRARYQGPLFYH
jgi:hypothetical protein